MYHHSQDVIPSVGKGGWTNDVTVWKKPHLENKKKKKFGKEVFLFYFVNPV